MFGRISFRPTVVFVMMAIPVGGVIAAEGTELTGLDPLGKVHIPIGIANSLDTLKTFVEAEGNFSPGVCLKRMMISSGIISETNAGRSNVKSGRHGQTSERFSPALA